MMDGPDADGEAGQALVGWRIEIQNRAQGVNIHSFIRGFMGIHLSKA